MAPPGEVTTSDGTRIATTLLLRGPSFPWTGQTCNEKTLSTCHCSALPGGTSTNSQQEKTIPIRPAAPEATWAPTEPLKNQLRTHPRWPAHSRCTAQCRRPLFLWSIRIPLWCWISRTLDCSIRRFFLLPGTFKNELSTAKCRGLEFGRRTSMGHFLGCDT